MSEEQIRIVMDRIPRLSDYGIHENQPHGIHDEEKESFLERREFLSQQTVEFSKAVEWLEQIEKTKTINLKRSSYGLKHIAEKSIGYISNGVFIAAAIHSGFKCKTIPNTPNVSFNMSEKSLKKIEK